MSQFLALSWLALKRDSEGRKIIFKKMRLILVNITELFFFLQKHINLCCPLI